MKLTFTTLVGILILSLLSSDIYAQPCANCKTQITANPAPESTSNNFYLSGSVSASKTVTLNWLTAVDSNVDHFEIERSFNGKDFSSAGMSLDGFENGSEKNYAFRDNSSLLKNQAKTVSYYRLKQISTDGKITYSNVLSINLPTASDVAAR